MDNPDNAWYFRPLEAYYDPYNNTNNDVNSSSTTQAQWRLVAVYAEPEGDTFNWWKFIAGCGGLIIAIFLVVLRVKLRYSNCSQWDRRSRGSEPEWRLPVRAEAEGAEHSVFRWRSNQRPGSVICFPAGPSLPVDNTGSSSTNDAPPPPPLYVIKLPPSAPPIHDVCRGTEVEDQPPKYEDAARTRPI